MNVYGVAVPGQDGRAGMAALLLAAGTQRSTAARFYEHVDRTLPRYAAPLFVRLLPEMEVTGTFKLRKVTLQEEGFDPARDRRSALLPRRRGAEPTCRSTRARRRDRLRRAADMMKAVA